MRGKKRMAETIASPARTPRSLRRNYPHQVQGVRLGRLSHLGSPAVLLTSLMTRDGKSISGAVSQSEDGGLRIENGKRQPSQRRYPRSSILYPRLKTTVRDWDSNRERPWTTASARDGSEVARDRER